MGAAVLFACDVCQDVTTAKPVPGDLVQDERGRWFARAALPLGWAIVPAERWIRLACPRCLAAAQGG